MVSIKVGDELADALLVGRVGGEFVGEPAFFAAGFDVEEEEEEEGIEEHKGAAFEASLADAAENDAAVDGVADEGVGTALDEGGCFGAEGKEGKEGELNDDVAFATRALPPKGVVVHGSSSRRLKPACTKCLSAVNASRRPRCCIITKEEQSVSPQAWSGRDW